MPKQASQIIDSGGLDLSDEAQTSPGSWLRDTRVARGFQTPESFAQPVGLSPDSIRLYERGKRVPLWERLHAIAEVLKVSDEEAVEGIWKEKPGDPCVRGCGGKKVLPDPSQWPWPEQDIVFVDGDASQLRHARMLPIALPCSGGNCRSIRIYLHRKLGTKKHHHRPLCPSCCHQHQVVKRISINCTGYHLPYFNRRQKLFASGCRTISLTRNQSLARQRRANLTAKDVDRARRNAHCSNDYYFFFDSASETGERRCWRCVKAARVWKRHLETLQALEPEPQITTMKQLKDRFHRHQKIANRFLKTGNSPMDRERGRKTYIERCQNRRETGEKWPEMTIGCMLRWWGRLCKKCKHNPHGANMESQCAERNCTCKTYIATELPSTRRFGVCVWCRNRDIQGWLIVTKDRLPYKPTPNMFHGPCWGKWRHATEEGRYFGPRKKYGQEASLPSYKAGDRPDEQTLRIRWSWFWQHFAGKMAYREIARQDGYAESTVREGVNDMITALPEASLVADGFKPAIELARSITSTD